MSKYTDEFKLSLVERYLTGAKGIQALAEEYGIMHSNLRRWAAIYRVHGVDGLKKRIPAKYSYAPTTIKNFSSTMHYAFGKFAECKILNWLRVSLRV